MAIFDPARRCLGGFVAVIAPVIASAVLATSNAQSGDGAASPPKPCDLKPGAFRTVTRVIDGETMTLDDGREVRLIGAIVPRAADAGATAPQGAWPAETSAVDFLSKLVLGQRVQLAHGPGPRTDRYGRLLAHLFIGDEASRQWVQGEMLAAGWARAYAFADNAACAADLKTYESLARTAHAGIWAMPFYQERDASRSGQLMQRRNAFEIVRGTVSSVARTASGVHLNFGDDWKSDFTVSIAKDVLKREPDFAASLDALKGRTVSARGWIERRNGPMIALTHSSQLDVLASQPDVLGSANAPDAEAAAAPIGPRPSPDATLPGAKQSRPDSPVETNPGGLNL